MACSGSVGKGHRAGDTNRVRAGTYNLARVVEIDSSESHDGLRGGSLGRAHHLDSDGGRPLVTCGRPVDRADREIVDPTRLGLDDLVHVNVGFPDHLAMLHDATGFANRHVGLLKMEPMCLAREGNTGVTVDYQQGFVIVAHRFEALGNEPHVALVMGSVS